MKLAHKTHTHMEMTRESTHNYQAFHKDAYQAKCTLTYSEFKPNPHSREGSSNFRSAYSLPIHAQMKEPWNSMFNLLEITLCL